MPTAMATIEHATQLLDFTQKLDITLLDSVVSCFYMAQGPQVHTYFPFILWLYHVQILEMAVWLTDYFSLHQQRMADQILTQLKQHPDAWTRVDTILEFSNNQQTKVGFNIWIFHKIYIFFWFILMILIPVFRAPNTRISHQDAMESSSVRAVRRLVSQ